MPVYTRNGYTLYGKCIGCEGDRCLRSVFGGLDADQTEASTRAADLRRRAEMSTRLDENNAPAREVLREVLLGVDSGASAILIGPVGTGKTHLTLTAALAAALEGHDARWIDETTLLRAWRSQSEAKTRSWGESVLHACEAAELLVLDDLGREAGATTAASAAIEALLDVRYRGKRSIIVSTNLRLRTSVAGAGAATLLEVRGERTVSRLVGMSGDRIVEVLGADRRRA